MNLFTYLLRNILYRKGLSALTIFSIMITVAFITTLILCKDGVEQGAEKGYGPFDVVVGAEGSSTQLVLNTFYHIGAPTGNVKQEVWKQIEQSGQAAAAYPMTTGDNYNGYPIIGIDPTYFMTRYGDQQLTQGRLYGKTGEIVIGAHLAKITNLHIGDTFAGQHGLIGHGHTEGEPEGAQAEDHDEDEHASFHYTVVGILPQLHTPDDRAIFTTVDHAWAVHHLDEADKDITAILVKPKSLMDAQQIKNTIGKLAHVQAVYTSKSVADVINMVDTGTELISIISALCVILASITILLSLVAATNERQKDIGLLRLIGKSRGFVWLACIGEGLLITGTGLILGLIVGHAGSYIFRDQLFDATGIQIQAIQWTEYHGFLIIVTLVIGLASSLIPSFKMYRVGPLQLFRS